MMIYDKVLNVSQNCNSNLCAEALGAKTFENRILIVVHRLYKLLSKEFEKNYTIIGTLKSEKVVYGYRGHPITNNDS